MNQELFQQAIRLIRNSKHLVAITGAGVSVESGIPPFRGENGLWNRYDPSIYASINGFLSNPEKAWEFFLELIENIIDARPNNAHTVMAQMEKIGLLKSVITQNIDGLHSAAGQRRVIEIHGNMRNLICLDCSREFSSTGMIVDSRDLPPRCACGGTLKPDAILFGESIPHERYFSALEQIRLADVLLLAGTSGLVHPVNEFPEIAIRHGATLIEINTEKTLLTSAFKTLLLKGKCAEILLKIYESLPKDYSASC